MAPFSDADIANDGFVCTCRADGLVHILDASDVQVRCGGCQLSGMGTALKLLPLVQNARPVLSLDASSLGHQVTSAHFVSRQKKRFIVCGSNGNRFVSLWNWAHGDVTCVQVLDLFPYIAGKCELLVDHESARLFILDVVRPAVLEVVLGDTCFESMRHLHLANSVTSAAFFKDGDVPSLFASQPNGVACIALPKAQNRPDVPRQHGSELDVQSLAQKLSELLAQQVCMCGVWMLVSLNTDSSPPSLAAVSSAG